MANPADPFNPHSERHRAGAASVAGDSAHPPWLLKPAPERVAGEICRINLATALSRPVF